MRHLLPITLILLSNALSGQSNVKLAEHLYRAEQWEKAKALYQNITQENPYNGTYWYRLGYSALKIQDYDQAISAFEKSTGLFSHPSNTYYNLACAYALQGNKARALDYLEKAWWTGFNDAEWIKQDTDLKILHGEKRFLELTGQAEIENLTGTSAWRKDLEYLVEQFEKGHPFLFHSITKEE